MTPRRIDNAGDFDTMLLLSEVCHTLATAPSNVTE